MSQSPPIFSQLYQSGNRYSHPCKTLLLYNLMLLTCRPSNTMLLHEYKMFYTKWKQREVCMKRTAMLLNQTLRYSEEEPSLKNQNCHRFFLLGLQLWGVVWGARRDEEKSCFGRTVWKIPGKFRFSFLLLARDTLNSHHHLHHARNWYKNTRMLGQHRTILERKEGGLCTFYNKRFQLLSSKSTSISNCQQIEKPVWEQSAL